MVDGRIILHHFVWQRSVMRSLARASLIHIARLPFQSYCIVIRNVKDMSHQYCNRQSSWGSLSLGGSSTCWNWRPASPVQPVLWPPRSPSPPGKPERDPSVEAMIKDTQLLRKHRGKHRNHKKHQKTKTKKVLELSQLHLREVWFIYGMQISQVFSLRQFAMFASEYTSNLREFSRSLASLPPKKRTLPGSLA